MLEGVDLRWMIMLVDDYVVDMDVEGVLDDVCEWKR